MLAARLEKALRHEDKDPREARVLPREYVSFQLAEVAVPRKLFAAILERIGRLRLECASG
jgi:hypothetical protein